MSLRYTTQIQSHCGSSTPTEDKRAQTRSQVLMTLPAERILFLYVQYGIDCESLLYAS